MSATEIAHSVLQALVNAGVEHVVVCPGSRSGPLALAALSAEDAGLITLHVRVDERTAGYLALGISKSTHRPAAIITTSGTAVANLHPAMLEAKHSKISLVAVTADRPARLRGTGANQTTDQRNMFTGVDFVNIDEPITELSINGVTQLNVELDVPLYDKGGTASQPFELKKTFVSHSVFVESGLELESNENTVVVAGDNATSAARDFAELAGLPLLAEPSSGARSGPNAIRTYRLLLPRFDVGRVVMFGHPTLSRPITNLLAETEVIVVGDDFSNFPHPPENARLSAGIPKLTKGSGTWLEQWQRADSELSARIDEYVDSIDSFTPYEVAREVARVETSLFIGSSNPIRDLDIMAGALPDQVFANRGLAGIDGTISSAIGVSLATGSPVTCYLGDLTFLHDSNGLLINESEPKSDIRFVIANDDGGSIFTVLEQGGPEFANYFERVFGTPTKANVELICQAFGVKHSFAKSANELREKLAQPINGIEVVEVPISRTHRREHNERFSKLID